MEKYGAENHMKTEKYREMFRGENSPRWKGGKTREERERDRSAEEYIAWRKSVFERDHFKCRMCGGKGHGKRGLEAHHIFNYNTNPDLRFLTDNGITFCYDCHKLFHSTYGKRGNNAEQINEFLGHGK
jgi:5-methylcytosine-specific restriction endonuclease McrA